MTLRLVVLLTISLSAIALHTTSLLGILPSQANDQVLSNTEIQTSLSVSNTARMVTVRILTNSGAGSGVIINQQGATYTVLTNAHVVTTDSLYTILTADGKTHAGQWLQSADFDTQDLALVQFTSDRTYQVAAIGNSDALTVGDSVYASGFPNWRLLNSTTLEETRNWGAKAFQLTVGKVGMLPSKPLQQGYQLGYTNQVEHGMSGGPVLNQYGQLVGINGGLKYPPQGIIAFIFADGTMPSEAIFQQMESLSWAIPIATFQRTFKHKTPS